MKLLHNVSDYGIGDPAFSEVSQRLLNFFADFQIINTSVPKFNTVATGFWISQLALGEHPDEMMIFSNTAPRKDKLVERVANAGEKFTYALLKNGVEITAVNAGFCFSFIKPFIKTLAEIKVKNHGSQFRSRDFYPQTTAEIARGNKDILGKELSIDLIPDFPTNQIAWVDGYGNIKTTIRRSLVKFKDGDKVEVDIGGVVRVAVVAKGSFAVCQGELAFSAGSSGYDDPFMELFLRGSNAFDHFRRPRWDSEIKLLNLISK